MIATGSRVWLPYCGAAPGPTELLYRWNFDPVLLACLALTTAALWQASRGRAQRCGAAAAAGIALILFVSPFCALSSALFSARVTHHVLLAAVLAPLLVFALPEHRTRWPGSLASWTGLQAVIFWLWHAPTLYGYALTNTGVYWAMQVSLLATSMGFWAILRRSSGPAAIGSLLFATVQMGLLGALITFAPAPLYTPHLLSTTSWGLGPLEDQQLAGMIMWIPSAGLYLAIALFVAWRWLARESREFAS